MLKKSLKGMRIYPKKPHAEYNFLVQRCFEHWTEKAAWFLSIAGMYSQPSKRNPSPIGNNCMYVMFKVHNTLCILNLYHIIPCHIHYRPVLIKASLVQKQVFRMSCWAYISNHWLLASEKSTLAIIGLPFMMSYLWSINIVSFLLAHLPSVRGLHFFKPYTCRIAIISYILHF